MNRAERYSNIELSRRNSYDTCYDREDESAIFIKNGKADIIGIIHKVEKGEIKPFTEEDVRL